jgi:hypothetical protein
MHVRHHLLSARFQHVRRDVVTQNCAGTCYVCVYMRACAHNLDVRMCACTCVTYVYVCVFVRSNAAGASGLNPHKCIVDTRTGYMDI